MRRLELDQVLATMLASQPEMSDLLFTVDRPPQVEAYGELKPVTLDPPIEKLTPFQTETIAMNIIGDNLWQIEDLLRHGSCDASYALSDKCPFPSQRLRATRKLFHRLPPVECDHPHAGSVEVPGNFQANPARKKLAWCWSPAPPAPANPPRWPPF